MSAEIIPLGSRRPRRRAAKPARRGIDLAVAWEAWEIALRARNRSEGTITSYRETVDQFAAWLDREGHPDDVEAITPEMVRAYLTAERLRTSPGNAHKLFRNLRAFMRFLVAEGERTAPSPVSNGDEPKVPEKEKPRLTDEQLKAVLATCKGSDFRDVRDLAILRLLLDTGPRSSGLAGIRYDPKDADFSDLNLAQYRVRIRLKGGDEYWAPIGKATAQALNRYVRARSRHPQKHLPNLWIGHRGGMTASGVQQMVERRGEQAGIRGLHPHWFRHTSATIFRATGGSEEEAMHVYGWKSTAMVRHYTKSEARERARGAHAKYSPGDRF